MTTIRLDDLTWYKILEFLRQQQGIYIGQESECRRFVEAIVWIGRSGAQWRLLPRDYGRWNSVYKRFNRWSEQGIWARLHQYFVHVPDLENLLIDSTLVRAHPCAAGSKGGSLSKR